MRVECDTCGAWIDASPIQCEAWLLDHPPGHPSWRTELDATQRDIWGTGYDGIAEKVATKRQLKKDKAKRSRDRSRHYRELKAKRARLEAELRMIDQRFDDMFD